MVCKEIQECPQHGYLFPKEVQDNRCVHCGAEVVTGNILKMSKSKKNVVDPEDLIRRYGADTVRMFCLFASPPERDLEWSDQGVEGSFRFLHRVWRLVDENADALRKAASYDGGEALAGPLKDLHRRTHQTIKKVTGDIEDRFHFNTAISAVMELVNDLNRILGGEEPKGDLAWSVIREAVEAVIVLLSPVAPHMTEELWRVLGHIRSLLTVPWPRYEEAALEVETRLVVIQVNGKVRGRIEVPASWSDKEIEEEALKNERVKAFIGDQAIKRVIIVRNKLVSIVI
jgi:leucyl-tRNA synthetase